jgi:hypothetical protein
MHMACAAYHLRFVKMFLEKNMVEVNCFDHNNNTPLDTVHNSSRLESYNGGVYDKRDTIRYLKKCGGKTKADLDFDDSDVMKEFQRRQYEYSNRNKYEYDYRPYGLYGSEGGWFRTKYG